VAVDQIGHLAASGTRSLASWPTQQMSREAAAAVAAVAAVAATTAEHFRTLQFHNGSTCDIVITIM
jgi:hypothetical protein